jgi:hypothetical protein
MATPSGMDDKSVVKGLELRLDTLVNGLQNSMPAGVNSLPVNGNMTAITDLVQQGQDRSKPFKSRRSAHAVLRQLGLTKKSDREAALNFIADLKPAIMSVIGCTSVDLTKFGFTPQKRVWNDAGNVRTRTVRLEVGTCHRRRRSTK